MTKLDEVKAMRISELDLCTQSRRALTERLLCLDGSPARAKRQGGYSSGGWKKHLDEIAEDSSVGELIDFLESRISFYPSENTAAEKNFFRSLVEQGLTKFDWPFLPKDSVSEKLLSSISLERWQEVSVLLLGTLLYKDIHKLMDVFGRNISEITVKDILHMPEDDWYMKIRMGETQVKLISLGFEEGDFPLLRSGSETEFREGLMEDYGLSKENAVLFMRIARDKGWG